MRYRRANRTAAFYLRVVIAVAYMWEVCDRLGLLGKPGSPHVGWGDWKHFIAYSAQVLSFLPQSWVQFFSTTATAAEATIGLLLLVGLFTRFAAVGSAILSACFALAMAVSFGIESPLGYSVFTLSAASLLLAGQPTHQWSVDHLVNKQKKQLKERSRHAVTMSKSITII